MLLCCPQLWFTRESITKIPPFDVNLRWVFVKDESILDEVFRKEDSDNFTSETLGPKRFKDLLVPVYEECFVVDEVASCLAEGP